MSELDSFSNRFTKAMVAIMTWGVIWLLWLVGVCVWFAAMHGMLRSMDNPFATSPLIHIPLLYVVTAIISLTISAACIGIFEVLVNRSDATPRVRRQYICLLTLGSAWAFGVISLILDASNLLEGENTPFQPAVLITYLLGIIFVPIFILAIRYARRWAAWTMTLYLGGAILVLILHGIELHLKYLSLKDGVWNMMGEYLLVHDYFWMVPFWLTRLFLPALALGLFFSMQKRCAQAVPR